MFQRGNTLLSLVFSYRFLIIPVCKSGSHGDIRRILLDQYLDGTFSVLISQGSLNGLIILVEIQGSFQDISQMTAWIYDNEFGSGELFRMEYPVIIQIDKNKLPA